VYQFGAGDVQPVWVRRLLDLFQLRRLAGKEKSGGSNKEDLLTRQSIG
jgi:hypothetical protein